jgi:hypothetical protein
MRSLLTLLTITICLQAATACLWDTPPQPSHQQHATSSSERISPDHPPPRLAWCLDYAELDRPELDFGADAEMVLLLFAGASDGIVCATDGLVVSEWLALRSYGYAEDRLRGEVVYLVRGEALVRELGWFLRDAVRELEGVLEDMASFSGRFVL